ncbi:MazG-like family protein [Clostridium sporogenes]|uniref:MazG-like family protein n=1 Tax=Clostridium sporogenes TaxID=1509 RepID=UPI0022374532|nr:MazG-like family protein [Clostridium sporogenes]MCW6111918.1 MazG-like family protein [Clostridium sporogenes]
MKLLMQVLKKNDRLKIDNTTITSKELIAKITEEYKEVIEAIQKYENNKTLINLKDIIRETYDLIQMCILVLWKCHRKSLTLDEPNLIKEINQEHIVKLIDKRNWIPEANIDIELKEWEGLYSGTKEYNI